MPVQIPVLCPFFRVQILWQTSHVFLTHALCLAMDDSMKRNSRVISGEGAGLLRDEYCNAHGTSVCVCSVQGYPTYERGTCWRILRSVYTYVNSHGKNKNENVLILLPLLLISLRRSWRQYFPPKQRILSKLRRITTYKTFYNHRHEDIDPALNERFTVSFSLYIRDLT